MKKRKFYNVLSKKYNLPSQYIAFKVNPIYIWRSNVELTETELKAIEDVVNWEYVKEDFERDRNRKESIFYGM